MLQHKWTHRMTITNPHRNSHCSRCQLRLSKMSTKHKADWLNEVMKQNW